MTRDYTGRYIYRERERERTRERKKKQGGNDKTIESLMQQCNKKEAEEEAKKRASDKYGAEKR
jgi:hypothetical protein